MITLGLVDSVDDNGVYVTMPGSRGVVRGPFATLQNVAANDRVLVVTTDEGESVIVGKAPWAHVGEYNVQDYGAVPTTSVDSTQAIQAAVDAAEDAGGGVVYVPGGAYRITDAIDLPSGVTLRGDGPDTSVLYNFSATSDFITSGSTSLVAVRDLQLQSSIERTAGAGINFTSVQGYILDNLRFIAPYNVADFTSCDAGWISRIKVAASVSPTVLNRGLWFQSCVETHITMLAVNGGATVLPADSAWVTFDSGCDTFVLDDVSAVASSGAGIALRLTHSLSPASFAPRWGRISNFFFEGSSGVVGEGRLCASIEAGLSVYFTNGYFTTGKSGIEITGGKDIRFTQSTFLNNWLYGASLNSSSLHSVTFMACTFSDNSTGADNNTAHLLIASPVTAVRVTDCYFGQTILGNANEAKYAVETNAVAGEVYVRGCRLEGPFGTGPIGGTVKPGLRDNRGYNPIGAVTPSVPSSGTPVTNDTGVDVSVYVAGGTVAGIAVGGTSTGITSGLVRVNNGQTITLTHSSAPTWVWMGD